MKSNILELITHALCLNKVCYKVVFVWKLSAAQL